LFAPPTAPASIEEATIPENAIYATNADLTASANQKVKPILNVARNLLNLEKGRNTSSHQIPAIDNVAEKYTTDEIISALTHLHQNITTDSIQSDPGQTLEKNLLNSLSSTSSSKKTLSNTDQNNIEVYESLFEILHNDMLLANDTQSYIQRIQLPIMTQAMLDPTFLESNDRPARKIVNHLYWLGSAITDNKSIKNTKIKQTIDQLIDLIINESPNNPEIFTTTEQQLNEVAKSVLQSCDYNTKRVTTTYEAKHNKEKAQHYVEEELSHRISTPKIPKIIVTLLESGWQQLLVIAKLKEDNNAFQSYLRTIINLISWLTGQAKASKEQAESTLEFIITNLQSVCSNTFLLNQIIAELKNLLSDDITQQNSEALSLVTPELKSKTLKTDLRTRHSDDVNLLSIGDWLAIFVEHAIEPLKLIWIAEDASLFVFVDRNGLKKLELGYEDLAKSFSNGSANKIESLDTPVMDRTINVMLQKMHKNLLNKA
ncbi:MAG: DUF1631 family protein, partial [Methylococcales bacterium]|nr:DUF1631 family protein [Methylococcales bacterium]